MKTEHHSIAAFELIRVSGRLDTSTADELDELVEGLKTRGVNKILFDLRQLDYISSYGIRIFAKLLKRGVELTLAVENENVLEIFEMAGLTDALHIKKDLAESLIEFNQAHK